MPRVSQVSNQKFFNQLINGELFNTNLDNFTPNLVGNAGEKIKATYDLLVYWFLELGQGEEVFNVYIAGTGASATYTLTINSGSFVNEGFAIGDNFGIYARGSRPGIAPITPFITARILDISPDGRVMLVDNYATQGGGAITGVFIGITGESATDNFWQAMYLDYGLVENQERFSNLGLATGSQQSWYGSGINAAAFVEFLPVSENRDWFNGRAAAKYNNGRISIEHEFIIDAFFTDPTNPEISISSLLGNNSLKYTLQARLRPNLTSPREIGTASDTTIGSVGGFNENFNGLGNGYSVLSIVYTDFDTADAATGLQLIGATRVTAVIANSQGFLTGERIGVYHFIAPELEADYRGTATNLESNFLYDSFFNAIGSLNTDTGIIKSVQSSINADLNLVVVCKIEYSPAQRSRLKTGDKFRLGFTHQKSNVSAPSSKRVMILRRGGISVPAFITGLTQSPFILYSDHTENPNIESSLTKSTWNEDGLVFLGNIFLNKGRRALVQSIQFNLVATNANETIVINLDSLFINLAGFPVTGNINSANYIHQVNYNQSRNYLLAENDLFNNALVLADGFDILGFKVGFKIKWQDWLKNNSVPLSFFDSTKPQNNLNFKSSNYDTNGFDVKIQVIVNTTGVDTIGRPGIGRDIYYGGNLNVRDYGVPNSAILTAGVISLHDPDTLVSTGGVALSNKDTLFRTTWESTDLNIIGAWGIHRIQETGASSDNKQELSSVVPAYDGILKPKTGFAYLDIYVLNGRIVTECLINFTKLQPIEYDYSARLQLGENAPVVVEQYNQNQYSTQYK